MKICIVVSVVLAVPGVGVAVEPEDRQTTTAEQEEFFETNVRPLLVTHCFECHSESSQKGGLRVDSLASLIRGGDSGPAVVVGNPAESMLVEAIEYESFEMPPTGKLKRDEIANLKRWIDLGAAWPQSSDNATHTAANSDPDQGDSDMGRAAESHWAFRPVVKPIVPPRDRRRPTSNEIDRFVSKSLVENSLQPSRPADRRTLLRRAYLDLLGVPPTPSETKRFLRDDSSLAFARLVDRLLDDPRYGERWGRHWLDVARYADSKGAIFGEPRDYPFAYTYRDYVVAAFNDDKPFDQFLREQIAADQLTDVEDDPSLAALGFLTVHRRANGGGQEAQWVDRVDTVTRGMLGLTVACARCHDHKYDPIPTADFYSLLGVFAGIEEPDELPIIARPPAGSPLEEQYNEFVVQEDEKRSTFISTNHAKILKRFRGEVGQYLLTVNEARDLEDGKLRVFAGRRKLNPLVTLRWKDYLQTHPDDEVFGAWQACAAIPESEFEDRIGPLITKIAANNLSDCKLNPRLVEAFNDRLAGSSRVASDGAPSDEINSLSDVADIYQRLFDSVEAKWLARQTDHRSDVDSGKLAEATGLADPGFEQLRVCLYGKDAPGAMPAGDFKLLDRQAYLKLLKVEADRKLRLALHPGSPRRAMVVRDTQPAYQPYVFLRGNKDRRGPEVHRQFLELLSGPNRKPFKHGSGRRELADAITAVDNPLTARVMVNRVWLWHFGKGLVATPSDFGLRADPPSHPELLDWMASVFVEDGWSLKKLHRRIMNSATYQQSSHGDAAKFAVDPDNRLLWRYNRRRLDYEAIHDSMLAVSGTLDPTRGGPAVQMIRDAGWAKVSNNQTNWTFNPHRRAIYGVVDRDRLPPLLPTFDFASPDESSAARDITTVPTQSLYLMNSEFVMKLAAALVSRSDVLGLDDSGARIRRIYELAFNRVPTARELAVGVRFTQPESARPRASAGRGESKSVAWPGAAESLWRFGHAVHDPVNGTYDRSSLAPFPFLGPAAMQGSKQYPDKKHGFGWLRMTPSGGHAAGGKRCVVRRFTSPVSGVVSIFGSLKHNAEQGNGVQATVYGPDGKIAQWSAHHSETETRVHRVTVQQGDTIDFVVDDRGDGGYDGFLWAPVVKEIQESSREAIGGGQSGKTPAVWASSRAFPKPRAKEPSQNSDVWQRYAHVLLMSNEFVFVE